MYGNPQDYTATVKASALSLGVLEDFVCTTYFATTLWLFDSIKRLVAERCTAFDESISTIVGRIVTFTMSWLLFYVLMAPFVADLMLVVYRDMRFSSGFLAALIRERHFVDATLISEEELHAACNTAAFLAVVAALFALVRVLAFWADLALWNPTLLVQASVETLTEKARDGVKYEVVPTEEGPCDEDNDMLTSSNAEHFLQRRKCYRVLQALIILLGLVVVPTLVVAVCNMCSPLVAYAALNATVNEMFLKAFQPDAATNVETISVADKEQPWVERYIDRSELHHRFGNDTLYRRTTGFTGDLAFNVSVDNANPPNVLIIAIESFRYRDSHYLVGEEDVSDLFKSTDMTITPQFDRWAKRGVALRNIWSSIPTSRSLESLLFGQVPYDSNVRTGITGGKNSTKLAGLPQLFTAKGYETFFTTGSPITFDGWDVFLPTHGFDTVWSEQKMKKLAEKTLNISHDDWDGDARRGFNWGMHDDLSFKLLGDLLVKKNREQKKRLAQGMAKEPLFLTHYTISSHAPFSSWPKWYDSVDKPDFSDVYEGERHTGRIKNYMEVRYFTDMELGKFMDRMETEGILNDTIVVIVGDHGQGPESDKIHILEESVTRVAAAIIAEGRLGDDVGLVIDDAAEQYDILNTLADITGLPEGGFEQHGIGRSLKRKVPFGQRVVFSNDPLRKMSVVRGHQRLRYDAVTDMMMLHDTEIDYHLTIDLLPELTLEEQTEWSALRDDGRRIASYYKTRWDKKCMVTVKCSP